MRSMTSGKEIKKTDIIFSRWQTFIDLILQKPHITRKSPQKQSSIVHVEEFAMKILAEEHSYTVQTRRAGILRKLQHLFNNGNNNNNPKKAFKIIPPFTKTNPQSGTMHYDPALFNAISTSSRLFSLLIQQEISNSSRGSEPRWKHTPIAFNFGSICHWLSSEAIIC